MVDEVALGLAVVVGVNGGRHGGRDGRRHGRLPQLRDLLLQGRQAGLEGLDAARLALDEGEKRIRRVGSLPRDGGARRQRQGHCERREHPQSGPPLMAPAGAE